VRGEGALDPVHRSIGDLLGNRRAALLTAAHRALQAHLPHQPLHRAASYGDLLLPQLPPNLLRAIHAQVRFPHGIDLDSKLSVSLHSLRQPPQIDGSSLVLVIRRRGDRQLLADLGVSTPSSRSKAIVRAIEGNQR
jgi:hypothetical protein